jgi:hypothetical protein
MKPFRSLSYAHPALETKNAAREVVFIQHDLKMHAEK